MRPLASRVPQRIVVVRPCSARCGRRWWAYLWGAIFSTIHICASPRSKLSLVRRSVDPAFSLEDRSKRNHVPSASRRNSTSGGAACLADADAGRSRQRAPILDEIVEPPARRHVLSCAGIVQPWRDTTGLETRTGEKGSPRVGRSLSTARQVVRSASARATMQGASDHWPAHDGGIDGIADLHLHPIHMREAVRQARVDAHVDLNSRPPNHLRT